MVRLIRWVLNLSLLLLLGAAFLVWSGTTESPLVAVPPPPTAAEHAWAGGVLRALKSDAAGVGATRDLALSRHQSELLGNIALERLGGGQLAIELGPGSAEVALSVPAPWQRDRWLNLSGLLSQQRGVPRLERLRLGDLPLPAWLGQMLLERALARTQRVVTVHQVELSSDRMLVRLGRGPDSLASLGADLLGEDERARLLARQARLADLVARTPADRPVSIAVLISGLIGDQTQGDADAIIANRDALVVLAAYVGGRKLDAAPGVDASVVRPPWRRLRLRRRGDLAQHYLGSAALAARGGRVVANMAGLTKELNDADGGSGFSFIDMAANRAGVRLAALATGSAAGADYLRRRARAGLAEDDLMPRVADLPEGLQRADFERLYRDTDSYAYRALVAEIDRRIEGLDLFRAAPGR